MRYTHAMKGFYSFLGILGLLPWIDQFVESLDEWIERRFYDVTD